MNGKISVVAAAALLLSGSASYAALTTGSIAFTGYNGDGNDNLAFVALSSIGAGEVIFFTDNEWNGGTIGGTGAWVDSNESHYQWQAPVGGVAAGTIILLNDVSTTISANLGTASYNDSTNVGVSASDEMIYAYQGGSHTSPTVFLAGVANDTIAVAGSITNTGLADGTTIARIGGDEDIFAYIGSRSGENAFSNYLSLVNNAANWISQDAGGDQSVDTIAPDVPFSSTPFTVVPEPASLGLIALAGLVGIRRRR